MALSFIHIVIVECLDVTCLGIHVGIRIFPKTNTQLTTNGVVLFLENPGVVYACKLIQISVTSFLRIFQFKLSLSQKDSKCLFHRSTQITGLVHQHKSE